MEEREESKEDRKNEKSKKKRKRKMMKEREISEEIQTDREKVNDLIFLLLSYKQEMIR